MPRTRRPGVLPLFSRAAVAAGLAATLTATTLALTTPPASAAPPDPEPARSDVSGIQIGPLARVKLPRPAQGRAALRLLGDDLPDAAAANGLSVPELRTLLREDDTAWLDRGARVWFADPARQAPAGAARAPAPLAAAPYPLADTFALHSKPGSRRTILLDFDGAVVSGTEWNENGVRSGFHQGMSIDADPATFTAAERTLIQDIWQRVAEDFAPFDVDVTTQDPGAAAITRTGLADTTYGTRALITGSDSWATTCEEECAGVAYLDVVDEPDRHARFQPAWIFSEAFDTDSPKGIAETISHEVGHNLALSHDGTQDEEYAEGHGIWAPIMGMGDYRPLTQWSQGSYPGATNTEDDLAAILGAGLDLRADEAGDNVATAAAVLPSGPAHITSRRDVDVYQLGSCTGAVSVTGSPAANSPNLDLRLRLLDTAGAPLASADPPSGPVTGSADVATGLGATVTLARTDTPLLVEVDGVGRGTWSTGYDDYGSLGAYTLALSGDCSGAGGATPPAAPATLTASADSASVTLTWTAPASSDLAAITGYTVTRVGAGPVELGPTARSHTVTGLQPATSYRFTVSARNGAGSGPSREVVATTPAATVTAPGAPRIGQATPGTRGRPVTAAVAWRPPSSTGGAALDGYRVRAQRLDARGRVARTMYSFVLKAAQRRVELRLPAGRWRFAVQSHNSAGWGSFSATSRVVRAR